MDSLNIALLGGLAGMVGYGVSDFLGKKTIDRIGTVKTFVYCQLIGLFILSLYLINDQAMPVFSAKNLMYVIMFGIAGAVAFYSFYKALELGKVSVVSPIASSFVIVSALVSFFLFGESFSGLKTVSLVVVICGIILTAINFKELKGGIRKEELAKGVPYAIVVLIVDGFWFPLWDRFITGQGWMVWTLIERAVAIVFIATLAILVAKESISLKEKAGRILPLIVAMAAFEALATIGNNWAFSLTEGTTSIVVAATSTYPMITAMLAYVFLKERLAFSQYVGIGLIILGIVLMPFI